MTEIEKPNSTSIPNVIFSVWMKKLSSDEFKVLIAICHKTFSYQKNPNPISMTDLEDAAGLSCVEILKSITILESHGLICKRRKQNKKGEYQNYIYMF